MPVHLLHLLAVIFSTLPVLFLSAVAWVIFSALPVAAVFLAAVAWVIFSVGVALMPVCLLHLLAVIFSVLPVLFLSAVAWVIFLHCLCLQSFLWWWLG